MKTRLLLLTLALLCLGAGAVRAQESLTVDDIVTYVESGAREEEIKAEVQRTRSIFDLSVEDVRRLEAAGARPSLIAFLKATRRQLSLEDIVRLVKEGMPDAEIVRRIEKTDSEFRLSPAQRQDLSRQGVSPAVMRAMMESSRFSVDKVLRMLRRGTPEKEIREEIQKRRASFEVPLADISRLRRAGASAELVRFLRRRWQFHGMVEFDPATGFFSLAYPEGWRHYAKTDQASVVNGFTPQKTWKDFEDIRAGFKVWCWPIEEYSIWSYLSEREAFQRRIRVIVANNADIEARDLETYREVRVGGETGQQTDLTLKLNGLPSRSVMSNVQANGFDYFFEFWAPEEEFESLRPTFEKMLRSFEPGEVRVWNRAKAGGETSVQELMDRNLESVLYVECTWKGGMRGQGSGFIIREDGYAITNAHVVTNLQAKKSDEKEPTSITVHWDQRVGRKPVRAKLIGHRYSWMPHIDVALIQLEGSGYKPLPITAEEDLHEGDTIFTMGFPKSFTIGHGTITTTKGIISRFLLLENDELNEIVIDAAITHGNSGGPCLSTRTGGVVGLNTFGMEAYDKDFRLNYNGVVPIRRAVEEYPAFFYYHSEKYERFTAFDHLSLGSVFLAQKKYAAARLEFGKATKKDPALADGHLLQGQAWERQAGSNTLMTALALAFYRKAHELEPENVEVLKALGSAYHKLGKHGEAIRHLDKAVELKPDDAWGYLARGKVLNSAHNFADALRDAKKAVEKSNDLFPAPLCFLGDVLFNQKEYDEALERYSRALEIDPRYWYAWYSRAYTFERMGKADMAAIEYTRMVEKTPDDPDIARIAGDFYFKADKYFEADKYYKKAYDLYQKQLKPPHVVMLNNLGWLAKSYHKDNDLAFSYLSEVLKAEMKSFQERDTYNKNVFATCLFYLGEIFEKIGRKGLARAHFEVAFRQNPKDGVIAEKFRKTQRHAMTFQDLVVMGKLRYHPQVPYFMAQMAPLPSTVPSFLAGYVQNGKLDEKKLQQDLGLVHKQVFETCLGRIKGGKTGGSQDPAPPRKPEKPAPKKPAYDPPPKKPKPTTFVVEAFKYRPGVNKYLAAFVLNNRNAKPVSDITLTFQFLDKGGKTLLAKKHVIRGTVAPGEKYGVSSFEVAPLSEVKRLPGFHRMVLSYTFRYK